MVFHQLKGIEVSAILGQLEAQTRWGGVLANANISAGHLLVVEKGGRGGSTLHHRPVAPFIAL